MSAIAAIGARRPGFLVTTREPPRLARLATLPAMLALGLGATACAGQPAPDELDVALARALIAHGWECDVILAHRDLEDGWHEVACADGRRYEVRFGPAWELDDAERRTMLRPLIDLARHAHALHRPDPEERVAAARALGAMGDRASPALGALVAALDDPDPSVRLAVTEALGAIGPAAEPAIDPLEQLAGEADGELEAAARAAIARIAPAAPTGD